MCYSMVMKTNGTRVVPKKTLRTPTDVRKALQEHAKAQAVFGALSFSHKKEYIQWITEAKRPETRARRVATTIQWLLQSKEKNSRDER